MTEAQQTREYQLPTLAAGRLVDALGLIPAAAGRTKPVHRFRCEATIEAEGRIVETRKGLTSEQLEELFSQLIRGNAYWHFGTNQHESLYEEIILVAFEPRLRGSLEITVGAQFAPEVLSIFALLEGRLGLREWHEPESVEEEAVERAADELVRSSKLARAQSEKLTCFFAHRFVGPDAGLANEVNRFLVAAGCEVRTGQTYQPRSVSEKVRELITDELDFIVVLIGPSGQSAWTRDEMGRAATVGVPVVPIVESQQKFASGLFGDTEYIPFHGECVGEAFVSLLEATSFARDRHVKRVREALEKSGPPNTAEERPPRL